MTALAATSRVSIGFIQESAYGTVPGAGNYKYLRMTGESLNYDVSKESSKEIRSDRQNGGATTVDAQAAGSINFHFQYAEYETLMAGALQSAWTVFGVNGVGATFTGTFVVGPPSTITASVATSGASDFTTIQKGQWIKLSAPTHGNDGKIVRVSLTTAPTTTVITLDSNTPLLVGAGVANCTVATARLVNGTTQNSYSIEKQFNDITQFLTFQGMTVSKMNLSFASAAITDGSFEFMGKTVTRATSTALPGTPVASYTYDIHNAVRGVGQLWEGGSPLTSTFVKSMTMALNNNLRGQKAIGNLGNVGIGTGDIELTGTCEVYFADGTIYDKFLADTYTSIIISSVDTSGNGYVITLPRVCLMNAKIVAQGENQDIMASFDYACYADDTNAVSALRKTVFIDRVGVAVT